LSKSYSAPPEFNLDMDKSYTATIKTNHGTVEIDLDSGRSPITVNNFVNLARDGFYDGVIFHRVIEGFMVQGGDPTGTGTGGPGYKFRDELEGSGTYSRGTVAMANAGPNTNGSQFFICHADVGLPHSYTIFGSVSGALDTVDAIATTATAPGDRPIEECVMESVTITEN